MENIKSGIVHVRIPSDKVDLLDALAMQYELNRSRLIKFSLQKFLDTVEALPKSSEKEFIDEIRRISQEWKVERPTQYKKKSSSRLMLVAEDPANDWQKPKKRGRKKKGDDSSSSKDPGK